MKHLFLFLGTILFLSCHDNIDLQRFGKESRLVVYAFPTDSDSIRITISASQPLGGSIPALHVTEVRCTTNGHNGRIVHAKDTFEGRFPVSTWYAIGKHRCGDEIRIAVRAEGLPEATGSTRIPSPTVPEEAALDTVYYKGNLYTQIRLNLPSARHQSRHAVRVVGWYAPEDADVPPRPESMEVETTAEPLLNHHSNVELGFGSADDFYHRMYTFDNSTFLSSGAVLHLNVWQQPGIKACHAQLFTLSEEYYSLLQSLNNTDNNVMASHGLAFAFSSYTNIRGGYGCIGGYNLAETPWMGGGSEKGRGSE